MITLIGTGHVFNLTQSLYAILDDTQPEVVCVELDRQRYQALLMKQQEQSPQKKPRNVPFIYRLLARFQESMADEYGVIPGSEMLAAVEYANTHQLPVELIDMNAQRLFTSMWKSMTLRERFRLFLSGFGGLFVSKQRVEAELKNYQDDISGYLDEIGKKFPTIKKVLIDDRNEFMVTRLALLTERFETIVACVGDGHVPGMEALLKEKNIEVSSIGLEELRHVETEEKDASSASFSTRYTSDDFSGYQ